MCVVNGMAIDFKRAAAGEKDEPDEADPLAGVTHSPDLAATMGAEAAYARARRAELDRVQVLDELEGSARLLDEFADGCESRAARLKDEAAEIAKKKIITRLFADAEDQLKRARTLRTNAAGLRAIKTYVLAHPLNLDARRKA